MADHAAVSGQHPGISRGAVDAHVHVWTPDQTKFPHDPQYSGPEYRPASFTVDEFLAVARPCGVERAVLVQMSFYGNDNGYLLDALEKHPGGFSGIAVVDHSSSTLEAEMAALRSRGVRGFRIYCESPAGDLEAKSMQRFWRLAAEMHMAICPLIGPGTIPELGRMCAEHPETVVVIDHMAQVGMDGEIKPKDIQALCRLARHPRTYVKVSAFYALGKKKYPYEDLIPLIHALSDAYGASRLMWGSDVPFQAEAPHTYAGSVELVRDRLDFLAPADAEWLLAKTAEKVFF